MKGFIFCITLCMICFNSNVFAQRGCCSRHGGVAYCDANTGRYVCRDGTYSPTCYCTLGKSDNRDNVTKVSSEGDRDCEEPENPYDEGSGHYAGFNWAVETGGSCDGNSESFNEGCEEYYSQLDKYNECEAKSEN